MSVLFPNLSLFWFDLFSKFCTFLFIKVFILMLLLTLHLNLLLNDMVCIVQSV